jgi:hypothetical protein
MCDRPEQVDDYFLGYEGVHIDAIPATLEEIKTRGWDRYILHTME